MTVLLDTHEILDRLAETIRVQGQDCDRDDTFVAKNLLLLKEAGLYRAMIPEELGGAAYRTAPCANSYESSPVFAGRRHLRFPCINTWWLFRCSTIGTVNPPKRCCAGSPPKI